jgi:hypothetical protein
MGVIKTALEIALEKTETVKSDKAGIEQFEAKQRGKKLAGAFLAEEIDLSLEIKNTPDNLKNSLKQGIFDVLITKITLPSGEDEKLIDATGSGLLIIIKNKQFNALFQQLKQVFSQYLQEAAHYEKAIRQQYAPKLRQKEEELSRRFGRELRIDPMQDPEFIALYNQHMNALKNNYESIIEEARQHIRSLFEENQSTTPP